MTWREHVAHWLNLYPEVDWDRMTHSDAGELDGYSWPEQAWVFGWVEREGDSYRDFVVLAFYAEDGDWTAPHASTSSALHSEVFFARTGRGDNHQDCQRVEDALGNLVDRKIVLAQTQKNDDRRSG
jgi:hypothetical protein